MNTFAVFQAYINLALREFINIFILAYLDDIVVYFERKKDYTGHVCLMLQNLRQYNLYIKLFKCVFDAKEIKFLGFHQQTREVKQLGNWRQLFQMLRFAKKLP